MNKRQGRGTGVGILLILAVPLLFGAIRAQERKPEPPAKAPPLTIVTETGKQIPCSREEWNKLPRGKVEANKRDGGKATFEGVSLVEVLCFAGMTFNGHLQGKGVATFLVVEGNDGYQATIALAEIHPSMTDNILLLADHSDGKPLPESAGPYRLIVPHDKIPSRWVKQVKRITIQRPAAATNEGVPGKK